MRAREEAVEELLARVTAADRRLALLVEASELLSWSLDYQNTLENSARMLVTDMASWSALYLNGPNGAVECAAVSRDNGGRRTIETGLRNGVASEEQQPALFGVLDSRKPMSWTADGGIPLAELIRDPAQLEVHENLGTDSLLIVPLLATTGIVGAAILARSGDRTPFDEPDVGLIIELARRIAVALENARLHLAAREANARLERRVQERTAELAEANRRLQEEAAQRQRAQSDLHDRERKLARAQRLTRLGSWSWRPQVGELVWSNETRRIFDFPADEQPTFERYLGRLPEGEREPIRRLIEEAVATGNTFAFEHSFTTLTGRRGFARCEGEVTVGEQGEAIEVFGTILDVTESKEAENAIRDSEARFRFLTENSLHVLATIELDGTIAYVSPSAQAVLGYEPQMLIGRNCLDLLHPDDVDSAVRRFWKLLSTPGEPYRVTYRYRHASGEWRILEVQGKLPDDEAERAVVNAYDVTQRVRAEEEVRALNKELRRRTAQLAATNRELEAFAYSVSHDLRAPLRAIDGFSLALQEEIGDDLEGNSARYLERIRNGATRMAELIEDLLQLSRLTRGELVRDRVDLSAICHQVGEELARRQPDRSVELLVGERMSATGDPRLITVVLENLLDNAWKFTKNRERARIEVGATGGASNRIYFVKDNGAGFDPAYSDRIFGAFQRLHDQTEFEGTGIGLATVQRVINRHGGRIWADGVLGEGATFYFTLEGAAEGEDQALAQGLAE